LDHYDSALYVFLAPFLAPIFFPNLDPAIALIALFGIKITGLFTRPFGSVLFGHLATRYSVSNLLAVTLIGVATPTFLIGLIPSYNSIGIYAPLLLVIIRGVQGVFASGEHSLAALFFIEQISDDKKCGKASSYYGFSSMSGTLLASLTAAIVSTTSDPSFYWRIAYISGIFTGIVGIYLRLILQYKEVTTERTSIGSFEAIKVHKFKLLKIIILQGFAMITYSIPFVFLNNFIPMVSDLKTTELFIHNTFLLIFNNLMIPFIGVIIDKYHYAKWMFCIVFALFITIIPIFMLLPYLNIWQVTLVKSWIVVLGVAFSVPLNVLIFKMVKDNHKYLINGFGYAVGTELVGRNIPVICLILWEYSHNLVVISSYLALLCFIAIIVLMHEIKCKNNG